MLNDSPLEIDVSSVKELLDAEEGFLFLDCREPAEHELCHINGTRFIPMGQIPSEIGSLEPYREERVVVVCHHGVRSLTVARWLRQQGYERAQSMSGGIDAWSTEIDPSVARY